MVILQLEEEPLLVQAIFSGDLREVQTALDCQADVNLQDCQKRSPLHAASYQGYAEIAALLLEHGASANSRDSRWITPLHRACCCGSSQLVLLLLQYHANTMARDKHLQTPLHVAAANNAVDCIELLLNYVSNINVTDRMGRTALHHASVNGHNDVVELLINKGSIVNACDKKDCRPLHYAAYMGHVDTIELLLRGGADLNVKDRNQYSPLHVAAASGMIAACHLLLDEGAQVDALNAYGNTPLHIACLNSHLNVCHILITYGANIEATNYRGQTPLHISAASIHGVDCLNYLVEKNININKQSLDGRTPLHMTAIHGRFTRSKTLIDKGAVVDCTDNNGCTALHVAAQYGHDLLANTLLLYGADPFKKGYSGRTSLHMSCLSGYVECCRKFLQSKVEINAQDDSGMTALHCAAYRGSIECLDLLVSNGARFDIVDNIGRLPLHYAAVQGHYQCVYTLVTLGSSVNTVDLEGCSPLHLAAGYNVKGDCVKYLLDHKADSKMKDSKGFTPVHYAVAGDNFNGLYALLNFVGSNYMMYGPDLPLTTPLHLAARNGNQGILELLLSYFHDVNIRTENGSTPLLLAACWGHTDCVQVLLRYGAKVSVCDSIHSMSPIHYSSRNGHKHSLALLLDNAEDKNVIDLPDSLQRTALMLAVSDGNFDCAKMLLTCQADPNTVDVDKHSSIFRAVVNMQHNTVQLLMTHGARVDVADVHGKTVLHLAAACGNLQSIQTIVKCMDAKAASALDNQKLTALHWACYSGSANCVSFLLDQNIFKTMSGNVFSPVHCAIIGAKQCLEVLCDHYGTDIINLKDARNRTPLHVAALHGQVDCAKYLLEKGAEVDCKDANGRTPLIAAAQNGQTQILDLLFNYKSDVTLYDNNANTALHLACLKKYNQTALLLLEHIDDSGVVNMVNNEKQTPLHLAARNGLVGVTRQLIKKGSSVLALDINGMTPALCCAPNQSVAQCLAIILANYSICSSQVTDKFLDPPFQKQKQTKSPARTREIQTNISLLQNPDIFECKRLFNLRQTPLTSSSKSKTQLIRNACDEKTVKSLLSTTRDIVQELTKEGTSDCFLIENYQANDGLIPQHKQVGFGLHPSRSHMSIGAEDVKRVDLDKRDRKRRSSFSHVYKMLKKILKDALGAQSITLKQEDLFVIVRQVMKKIDRWQWCVSIDNSLEEELRKCLNTFLKDCKSSDLRRVETGNLAPKLKVIETSNDDDIVKVDVVMRREQSLLEEAEDCLKYCRKVSKITNRIESSNEELELIKDVNKVKSPERSLPESAATNKEQELLERLKEDLVERRKNAKCTLSSFHVKPTALTCNSADEVGLDEGTQTGEIQPEGENSRIISGTVSEVALASIAEEIRTFLERGRDDQNDITISESNDSDNSYGELDDDFEEDIVVVTGSTKRKSLTDIARIKLQKTKESTTCSLM